MTKMSKPVGSRVQRPKRHLAEARKAAFDRLAFAREQAVDALVAHARDRALRPVRTTEPPSPRSRRSWAHRAREWALRTVAKAVAAKIERDTFRHALNHLEERKLSFDAFFKAVAA